MTPLAIIEDYADLVIALRARQNELGISHEVLSEMAGVAERYSSKLLSLKGCRRFGMASLGPLLGGPAVKLVVVVDERRRRRSCSCRHKSRLSRVILHLAKQLVHVCEAKLLLARPLIGV
jgi:hypothetical protein